MTKKVQHGTRNLAGFVFGTGGSSSSSNVDQKGFMVPNKSFAHEQLTSDPLRKRLFHAEGTNLPSTCNAVNHASVGKSVVVLCSPLCFFVDLTKLIKSCIVRQIILADLLVALDRDLVIFVIDVNCDHVHAHEFATVGILRKDQSQVGRLVFCVLIDVFTEARLEYDLGLREEILYADKKSFETAEAIVTWILS